LDGEGRDCGEGVKNKFNEKYILAISICFILFKL
jgi:hypothetical protein